ncbi:branched-chain amino acid ABC transporter permease [Ornithinimicrobium sufpigmenti]|uniref:branched-chain amino acid ABC transporter permease n=1 Tax=Ornithinimicrobium sufpigmenti TaxID=2508882 RepID=UPI0015E1B5E6|nr:MULTISPECIES: branched-chain amino acid ABC transporter permease [unclassified Ornithinimicrobium]
MTLFVFNILSPSPALAQTPDDPSQVNLEEHDQSITVNLRNDNEPVEGARVVVSGGGYEAEATTNDRGQARIGVPTTDPYEVLVDEETLPEGIAVTGENPLTVNYGSQFFQPGNFFLGEGERETASFASQFTERLMNGVNFGLMLALASIGLSLIFGTTGLTNFAHAEMVTFGAVMAYFVGVTIALPIWVAIPLAVLLSGALGWAVDASIWRPLRRRGIGLVQLMILTIGLSLAGRYVFQMFIGGGTLQLPGAGGIRHQIIGPIRLSTIDMVSMGISLTVLILVALWLLRTRTGKATRAVADNRSLASASGIDVEAVTRLVWVAGGALAGLSGILWAYFRPGIKWDMGVQILLLIFAAVVLGGLGTAFGALIGALAIGILVEVSTLWIPSDIKYVGALGVLILILLVRPQGLLGRRARIG